MEGIRAAKGAGGVKGGSLQLLRGAKAPLFHDDDKENTRSLDCDARSRSGMTIQSPGSLWKSGPSGPRSIAGCMPFRAGRRLSATRTGAKARLENPFNAALKRRSSTSPQNTRFLGSGARSRNERGASLGMTIHSQGDPWRSGPSGPRHGREGDAL